MNNNIRLTAAEERVLEIASRGHASPTLFAGVRGAGQPHFLTRTESRRGRSLTVRVRCRCGMHVSLKVS